MALIQDLTARQVEVVQLIGKGLTNKEVANMMNISVHTVKAHIASLLRSLEVSNRTEAVFAYQQLLDEQNLEASVNQAALPSDGPPAVAILPLINLSEHAEHAHLGESIGEELSIRVASIRHLPVIAFSSCRNYSSSDSVGEIAQKLGAQYLVTGSVQWLANAIRVNVEVQNVKEQTALWSQTYQQSVDDIFSTLNQITIAIASALNFQLIDDQVQHLTVASGAAWNEAMQGMRCLYRHTYNDYHLALGHFNTSIEHSPSWAIPYAGRAQALYQQWFEQHCEDRGKQLDLIEADALKAIDLDPQLANGHMVYALLQVARGQGAVAVQSLKLALSLNPSLAPAHSLLGQIAGMMGDDENALKYLHHALKLNPRDPHRWSYFAALAMTHLSAKRYPQAVACAGEALSFSPQSGLPYVALILGYAGLGDMSGVEKYKAALYKAMPQFELVHLQEMLVNAAPSVVEPVFATLKQLGVS